MNKNRFDEDMDDDDASQSGGEVWLAAPWSGHKMTEDEEGDAFFCRLGGLPTMFRSVASESGSHCLTKCPECGKSGCVRLLCQAYNPQGDMDRVFYVMQCETCSSATRASIFVHRSSNLREDAVEAMQKRQATSSSAAAEQDKPSADAAMFAETDDWGDDDGDTGAAAKAQPPSQPPPPSRSEVTTPCSGVTDAALQPLVAPPARVRTVYDVAALGTLPHNISRKHALAAIPLDVFEEPKTHKNKDARRQIRAEEVFVDAEGRRGADVVDNTSIEEDDETDKEKCTRRFIEAMAKCPSQCIRWASSPLLCRVDELPPDSIPACGVCGAPRRFEFQVLSPAIYFLTKGLPEAEHSLHFGTILVFSCSADCDDYAYSGEFCFVQSEI